METRVYAIPCDDIFEGDSSEEISDEKFMDIAEENGTVWSLKGFQDCFNYEIYRCPDPDNYYIRFINI